MQNLSLQIEEISYKRWQLHDVGHCYKLDVKDRFHYIFFSYIFVIQHCSGSNWRFIINTSVVAMDSTLRPVLVILVALVTNTACYQFVPVETTIHRGVGWYELSFICQVYVHCLTKWSTEVHRITGIVCVNHMLLSLIIHSKNTLANLISCQEAQAGTIANILFGCDGSKVGFPVLLWHVWMMSGGLSRNLWPLGIHTIPKVFELMGGDPKIPSDQVFLFWSHGCIYWDRTIESYTGSTSSKVVVTLDNFSYSLFSINLN